MFNLIGFFFACLLASGLTLVGLGMLWWELHGATANRFTGACVGICMAFLGLALAHVCWANAPFKIVWGG